MRLKTVLALILVIGFADSTWGLQRRNNRNQPKPAAEVSAEAVRGAIKDGVRFLASRQGDNGRWKDLENFADGTTALAALAMLNAGDDVIPNDSKPIQAAITQLLRRDAKNLSTYALSLRIMVLANKDPQGRLYLGKIREDVRFLESSQRTEGGHEGGWGYGAARKNSRSADASNSQFAILALHEASLLGINIDEAVWIRAKRYWSNHIRDNGFVYDNRGGVYVTGSMTCAGISSWLIINENLAQPEDFLNGGRVACCGEDIDLKVVQDAMGWLGDNFTVKYNPPRRGARQTGAQLYYLYAMERAGRLSGERFIGDYDWYREGAAHLVGNQARNGSWTGGGGGHSGGMDEVSTAFALLFLSKGKRPVVFGKYQHTTTNDWDRHPKGVHYLTRDLGEEFGQKLNWQTIRGADSTVDDLLEAPVLFISGRDELKLTEVQKDNLKKYIENGGFIFAEACQGDGCGENVPFDRSFRALIAELFPEGNLEPLAVDHPIWTANFHLKNPDPDWPVLGLQACCRTSVVYVPRNLTGYWRMHRKNLEFPRAIANKVEYCSQLGVNVAAYATGRKFDDKGDRPKIEDVKELVLLSGRNLQMPKLRHSGGADDAPNAWRNLQGEVRATLGLRIDMEKKLISPTPEQLAEHPFIFMHGRKAFRFTREERAAIRRYLELGGFIFADSICSSREFTDSFRKEFAMIGDGVELTPLAKDHPILSGDGRYHQLNSGVVLRKPDPAAENGVQQSVVVPTLEALEIDGRLAVIFSPYDISCALENATATQCEGYSNEDAIRIGTNVIKYRLENDE